MGSPCRLQLLDAPAAERIAERAIAETRRIEAKYTRFEETSVTSAISRAAGDASGIEVDAETAALLDYAAMAHRESGGLFDVTSGVLREAWDWKSGRLPTQRALDAVLPRVGWEKVRWHSPRIALTVPGMEIDLGGIVKEYAADRVAELCRTLGARHGLVDLGGDIALIGPRPDGAAFAIGIRDPRRPDRAIARVSLRAGAIASSGDYERFMLVGGERYCHILDPRTGWPVRGLAGVSVLAPHCVVAGSAATIAMLKGEREGPAWLEALGLPWLTVDARLGLAGALARTDTLRAGGAAAPTPPPSRSRAAGR
jgi:thiamine biosynthesis lipoprotein